jgi:hypothetical protein
MIFGLLIALAGAAPVIDPVADPRYRFCPEATASRADVDPWCEALDALPPQRCPGLREVCAGEVKPAPSPGCSAPNAHLPVFSLQGALAVVVAIGVCALAIGLLRRRGTPGAPASVVPPARDEVLHTQAPDWISFAEQDLQAGRWLEAVERAREAAWQHLVVTGQIDGTRAMTDREVGAALGAPSEGASLWAEIREGRERPRWACGSIDVDTARRVVRAAIRLAQLGLWLALWPSADAWAGRDAPNGDNAWFDAFSGAGFEVSWAPGRLTTAAIGPAVDVVVWDAERAGDEGELRAWVEAGGVLLVLGDATEAFPELGAFTAQDGEVRVTRFFPAELPIPRWPSGVRGAFLHPTGEVWVESAALEEAPTALFEVIRVGEGAVLAWADRRMLGNVALVWPENVSFLLGALSAAEDRGALRLPENTVQVAFATRGRPKASSPVETLRVSGLFPLVAHLLALGLLVVWWKGWRFERLPERDETSQRLFSEHIEALGHRYAERDATRFVYARWAKYALERYGARQLAQRARRTGYSAEAASERVRRWRAVADDPGAPNRPEDRQEMEELWKILRH